MGSQEPEAAAAPVEDRQMQVVLAGNPNVGKSVFFGYLTGIYAEVSNYPGTTIEISRGRRGDVEIIDTPGIYGVSSFNDEEAVARDIIVAADRVLNIVAATHLERDLSAPCHSWRAFHHAMIAPGPSHTTSSRRHPARIR